MRSRLFRFRKLRGFTVNELLIVIVVIGILATIVVVAYRSVQEKAQLGRRQADIQVVQYMLKAYYNKHGEYPATTANPVANWKTVDVRTDDNCFNGSSQKDWVPNIVGTLPQSSGSYGAGVDGITGCYLYASNGSQYILSAWNMVPKPQSSTMYRRLGFREFQTSSSTQFYTCNSNVVGGANGGYNAAQDYYKHSYTISNITDCNETPPPGA
jgi:prepilin-type N-terminal cleavage/methylation domain-containing protein